jgi:two-component system sensor histidine kinase DesK
MLIEDDGHGFDPESLLNDDKPHFGLRFMNERVEQLGGSIGFEPAQPSGTRVLVEIPIHKEKPS